MKKQSIENHARIHPPYHFVGSFLIIFTFIGSIIHLAFSIRDGEGIFQAILMVTGVAGLFLTFGFTRVYAMKVQDRVIRSEENLRHYLLTQKPLDPKLSLGQIIALRFASDEEFPELCERTIKENLKPIEIKKAIQHWRADHHRV